MYTLVFFLKNTKKKNGSVIDIGIGMGLSSYILSQMNFKVDATDIQGQKFNMGIAFDQNELINDKFFNKINFKYSKKDQIPFINKKYDIIFLYAVLEHISPKYYKKFLKNLQKLSHNNTEIFIFKLPRLFSYTEHLGKLLYGKEHVHDKLFTKKMLKNDFKTIGYKIDISNTYDLLPMTLIKKNNKFLISLFYTFKKMGFFYFNILSLYIFKLFSHNIRAKITKI